MKPLKFHTEGKSKNVMIIYLLTTSKVEKSQHQRFTSIIQSYCNMPCLDCIIFRFSTAVVNDKILQLSISTFLTLSIYKFIVWHKSSLNKLRVLHCFEILLYFQDRHLDRNQNTFWISPRLIIFKTKGLKYPSCLSHNNL